MSMIGCPATREAVEERELWGEVGCPICDMPAYAHRSESDVTAPPATDQTETER